MAGWAVAMAGGVLALGAGLDWIDARVLTGAMEIGAVLGLFGLICAAEAAT